MSRDHATALQLGQKRETPSKKKVKIKTMITLNAGKAVETMYYPYIAGGNINSAVSQEKVYGSFL